MGIGPSSIGGTEVASNLNNAINTGGTDSTVSTASATGTGSKAGGGNDPPKIMPPQIVKRIQDLRCPPPILPSKVTAKINVLNAAMQAQMNEIEVLESLVSNLESRYKISFTCNNNPKFDLNSENATPKIDLSGNLTNINLDLYLNQATQGVVGIPGDSGETGLMGTIPQEGPVGIPGYYGIKGNTPK